MRKERMTLQQAQEAWDEIRANIRLAKFNDEGLELPAIDMERIFAGRIVRTWPVKFSRRGQNHGRAIA